MVIRLLMMENVVYKGKLNKSVPGIIVVGVLEVILNSILGIWQQ